MNPPSRGPTTNPDSQEVGTKHTKRNPGRGLRPEKDRRLFTPMPVGCFSVPLCALCGQYFFRQVAAARRRRAAALHVRTASQADAWRSRVEPATAHPFFFVFFAFFVVEWFSVPHLIAPQSNMKLNYFSPFPELSVDTYRPGSVPSSTVEQNSTFKARMI